MSSSAAKPGKRRHEEMTEDVSTPAHTHTHGEEDAARGPVGPMAPIAQPLAGKKLTKKLFKAVKKAAGAKHLRRGVKECVKALRKGESGLCVLAGDISPYDVISHIPIMCEDTSVPYVFVPSKAELGAASSTKRPTSVVLISTHVKGKAVPTWDGRDKVDEVLPEIKELAAAGQA